MKLSLRDEDKDASFDRGYLTGVHDAYAFAKEFGYHEFAERLVIAVNQRAEHSGLPKMEVR